MHPDPYLGVGFEVADEVGLSAIDGHQPVVVACEPSAYWRPARQPAGASVVSMTAQPGATPAHGR